MTEQIATKEPTQSPPPPAPLPSRVRYDEAWQNSFLRPILIAILVVCLDVAVVNLAVLAIPTLPPAYPRILLMGGVISALIGGYTTTILAQERNRLRRYMGFRLAEIGLILITLRLLIWFFLDTWPTVEAMLVLPLETLFTGDFLAVAVVAFLSWQFANLFTGDFNLMALQPDELLEMAEESPEGSSGPRQASLNTYLRGSRADRAQYIDRMAIVRRFATRWIFGAVLLMLMTAAARFGGPRSGFMALARQNIDPGVIGAAVVYFLVGLILISQGQLAALRARWALENIRGVEGVMRRWPVYATLLILGMGLGAALMPFGGTFRLAQILNAIIGFIQTAVATFITLFFLLLSLIIKAEDPMAETPDDPMAPLEIPPAMAGEPIINATIPPWIGGAFFWTITGLILGYAALIYLRGRGLDPAWIGVVWQRLRQTWLDLWQNLRSWQHTVAESLRTGRERQKAGPTRRPALLRRILGQMSPAEQIQYYYIDTLAQAAEHGIPRKASETPRRYAPRLLAGLDRATVQAAQYSQEEQAESAPPTSPTNDPILPTPPPPTSSQAEANAAVTELTLAFEQVKYAARPAESHDASRIKQLWGKLTQHLRLGQRK